jgi:hypothetical protein
MHSLVLRCWWVWLQVKVEYDDRVKISEICSELDVDGLRGDMVRTCGGMGMSAAAAVKRLHASALLLSLDALSA